MTTYEITFNEKSAFGKNLLAFLEQNKKYVKVNDPTKMTKEEFDDMLAEAEEEWKRGAVIRVERKDIKKFLGLE